MDGGFFTFDDILAGQTQAPGVGLSQAGPVWNFERIRDLTAKDRASAAQSWGMGRMVTGAGCSVALRCRCLWAGGRGAGTAAIGGRAPL